MNDRGLSFEDRLCSQTRKSQLACPAESWLQMWASFSSGAALRFRLQQDQLRVEVEVLRSLQHPHLPRVVESFEECGSAVNSAFVSSVSLLTCSCGIHMTRSRCSMASAYQQPAMGAWELVMKLAGSSGRQAHLGKERLCEVVLPIGSSYNVVPCFPKLMAFVLQELAAPTPCHMQDFNDIYIISEIVDNVRLLHFMQMRLDMRTGISEGWLAQAAG